VRNDILFYYFASRIFALEMQGRQHADGYWANQKNVRQFFEDFASEHKLNPLDESTWYAVPSEQLHKLKVCALS